MRIRNFTKPLNASRIFYSYLFSVITRNSIISGMPVSAGIEISAHCNLMCPECTSGSGSMTRQKGFMEPELFARIVEELEPWLYNINLYFQGEPMLHPRFFDFLEKSKGIKVTVSTNGHFLSPANSEKLARSELDRIIVSIDGMDNETYSLYRQGGDLEQVINGIRNISKAIEISKSSLKLEIQFLVNRYNEDQISSVRRFSKENKAILRLKSMQIMNEEHIDDWMPANEKFRRYEKTDSGYTIKSTLNNSCFRLWYNPVITWDGKVVPCCFDKNADNVMGDLTKCSFRTIWNGNLYRSFRSSILSQRKSIEICRNCTSGLKGIKY